jgi:hypothetical protein
MTAQQTTGLTALDGLRVLVALAEANPEVAALLDDTYALDRLLVPVGPLDDPKAALATFIRAAKAAGHPVAKSYDDNYGSVDIDLGGVTVQVYAERAKVCERVVRGTKTVTRTVKDPDALAAVADVEVTETVEDVEWVCAPLLDTEAVSS